MGPLRGVKVVELVGLGPGPFAGMLLADMGAEVLRVDRVAEAAAADRSKPATNAMNRGKQSMGIDLKRADGAPKDWRRAVGKCGDSEFMRQVDAEGQALREAERAEAQSAESAE